MPIVYLLHLIPPYRHAKHYTGWTARTLDERLKEHRGFQGRDLGGKGSKPPRGTEPRRGELGRGAHLGGRDEHGSARSGAQDQVQGGGTVLSDLSGGESR